MAHFFFGSSRKYILTMLNSFSKIVTQRVVDGQVLESKVPIVWGTKERSGYQNEESYTENARLISLRVPRMSLTMDGMEYDSTRKINRLSKDVIEILGTKVTQFPPVPYNFNFTLHILTKTLDDYFQIIEQILPYFNPNRNFNIYEIPGQTESTSVKVSLSGVTFEPDIDYDENGDVRFIRGTIGMTLAGNMYMPVKANDDIIYTIYSKYYPTLKAESDNFEEFMVRAIDTDADTIPDTIQPLTKTHSIER